MYLTLDEAIDHAEEVANEQKKKACNLYDAKNYEASRECVWCSEEHRQLAEWLKELKQLREQTRWIPADESPKTSGKYLVVHGGTNLVGIDNYTTEEDAKETYDEWYEAGIGWDSQNVIKWMPLPEQ